MCKQCKGHWFDPHETHIKMYRLKALTVKNTVKKLNTKIFFLHVKLDVFHVVLVNVHFFSVTFFKLSTCKIFKQTLQFLQYLLKALAVKNPVKN